MNTFSVQIAQALTFQSRFEAALACLDEAARVPQGSNLTYQEMLDVGYFREQLDGLLGGFCWGLTGQELTCQAKKHKYIMCIYIYILHVSFERSPDTFF